MRKTFLLFLLLTLLPLGTVPAQASNGSFSVNVYLHDFQGGALYDDVPLTLETLADGLTVTVENRDRNSCDIELLALYRGHLLPFRVEDAAENVWQYPMSFARGEEGSVHIHLDEEALSEVLLDDTYLFLVAAEAVDVNLSEQRELYSIYASAGKWVSRTASGTGTQEPPTNIKELSMEEQMNRPMRPALTITALDGEKTDGSSRQTVSGASPEITYTIENCWVENYLSDELYGEIVIIPMVNGQLCLLDGRPLTCSAFGSGETVEGTVTLPLKVGENQVFFLLCPVSDTGWFDYCFSQRYVINVEE